jgi:hypothetical protein
MYMNVYEYVVRYGGHDCLSFGHLVAPNDSQELIQILLLHFSVLPIDQALSIDTIQHLFLKLFNTSFHPMIVIRSRLDFLIFELFLDIAPYLSDPEMGVELDDLNLLLLMRLEIILIKPSPVQYTEHNRPQIIIANPLSYLPNQIRLSAGIIELSEIRGGRVFVI